MAAARAIHENRIDILVDLKGYTQGARPQIMALRPAPVQINWLGYPGTMGAPFMEYLIADRIVVPKEDERYYTEKIAALRFSYQPNDNKKHIGRTGTRREAGLPDDAFVFCCFNNRWHFFINACCIFWIMTGNCFVQIGSIQNGARTWSALI